MMKKLKQRKGLVVSIIAIVLIVFIFIASSYKRENIINDTNATNTVSVPSKQFIASAPSNRQFFLNRINNIEPVIDYFWQQDLLFIITPEGIVDPRDNSNIYSGSLTNISYSKNGIVLANNNGYFLFNLNTKEMTSLENIPSNNLALIGPEGNIIAFTETEKVTLMYLASQEKKEKFYSEPINNISWTLNNNIVVSTSGKSQVLNSQLEELWTFSYPKEEKYFDTSEEGDKVITSINNKIFVHKEDGTLEISINEGSSLQTAKWYNDENFFFVEKLSPDSLGRELNRIWSANVLGQITFVTDSTPIVKRFSDYQRLETNQKKTFLPIIENAGNLWIISLTENMFPYYSSQGAGGINLPTNKQDDH